MKTHSVIPDPIESGDGEVDSDDSSGSDVSSDSDGSVYRVRQYR